MRAHIRLGLLTPLVIVMVTLNPVQARALQSPQQSSASSALAVSPAITEQVTPAALSKTIVLQVTNITAFPLPISSRVKNFVPLEQIEDQKDMSKYDASIWFTVTNPDFILQPKETRKVSVSITPPAGAEPGGHYATIYFTPLIPDTALSPSTAYLSAQVGTLAFLIVPGHITEKLSATDFATAHVHQSRAIDFSVTLKNTGSVHLAPDANINIRDWHGKQIASIPVKAGVVLPGTEKVITIQWHAKAFIGKYSASLEVQYGASHTETAPMTVSFWVVPWGLLSGVMVPVALGGLVYWKTRGRWRRAWAILIHNKK